MRVLVRLVLGAALLWLLGFAWFVVTLPGPAPRTVTTDGIVVLTGGPGRIARGIELLQRNRAERMLVSGVDAVVRPQELAAELGVGDALFACCVDLGKDAFDTRSNGREVAEWARAHEYRSLRLVTADAHMPRARAEIEARLPDSVALVPDAVPGAVGTEALLTEYAKYLAARTALALGLS